MSSKDAYHDEMRGKLAQLQVELDNLKGRGLQSASEARSDCGQRAEALELSCQEAEALLAMLQRASEDSWESLKLRIEMKWHTLREAIADRYHELR